MYVLYIYAYICLCVFVCVYALAHKHTHVYMYIYIYIYACVRAFTSTNTMSHPRKHYGQNTEDINFKRFGQTTDASN